jgi:hypothetical protein
MTHNPQSDVYEYWTGIAADSFSSDGLITVDATVYGNDGGTRTLETLTFTVNPNGTLPRPQAWVDADVGSDTTGTVNDESRAYATIGRAIQGIRLWRRAQGYGDNADGGIVLLKPGTDSNPAIHLSATGEIWSEIPVANEWVTVTAAPGGTRANTILRAGANPFFDIRLMAFKGITLTREGSGGFVYGPLSQGPSMSVWVHDCSAIGLDLWTWASYVISHDIGAHYYTGTRITNSSFAVPPRSSKLCRGLTIEHIGNDAFQEVPMVVNCTVDDVDPGPTGWHANAWQYWTDAGPNNTIVYNLRATGLRYEGIRAGGIDYTTFASNVAFVNVYLDLEGTIYPGGGMSAWFHPTDHLLLWNCTFRDQDFEIFHASEIRNFDVRGNVFQRVLHNVTTFSQDVWDQNHFVDPTGLLAVTPGTNVTTGNPVLDLDGRPGVGSPLVNRLSPLKVNVDAGNQERLTPGDLGAFED